MKKAQTQQADEPKVLETVPTYIVLAEHVMWGLKKYVKGSLITTLAKGKDGLRQKALYLKKEWIRLATPQEQEAVPPIAPAKPGETETTAQPAARATASQAQAIALDRIRPDPTQPRKEFGEEAMKEMVDSIRDKGILQPIQLRPMSRWRQIVSCVARLWVRRERGDHQTKWDIAIDNFWSSGIQIALKEVASPDSRILARLFVEGRIESTKDGTFPTAGALAPLTGAATMTDEEEWLEIVYGERRWRGSQAAGVATIPAKVDELSDIEAAELQAIENLKRADLLPMEDAAQYRKLMDTPGYGLARLMEVTGKAKNTIYGKLKLLELPPQGQEAIRQKKMLPSVGERIGRLPAEEQSDALKAVLKPPHWAPGGRADVVTDAVAQRIIGEVQREHQKRREREKIREEAQGRGLTWIEEGSAAYKKVFGHSYRPTAESGLVELGQSIPNDPQCRDFGEALKASKEGKAALKKLKPTMALCRNEKLVELYPAQAVGEALSAAGVKLSKAKATVSDQEAMRRKRDKRNRAVLAQAAMGIFGRAQDLAPSRAASTREIEQMWRNLVMRAIRLVSRDDCRDFYKRRNLEPLRDQPYHGQKVGTVNAQGTVEAYVAKLPVQQLTGALAELLLMPGAWYSHSSDFAKKFRLSAAVFGVDLRALKLQAGATEAEIDAEEKAQRAEDKRWHRDEDEDGEMGEGEDSADFPTGAEHPGEAVAA